MSPKHVKCLKSLHLFFRIILVQGLNRQIRRMCQHYHYSVEKLERIRIMHVDLKSLAAGQWRQLPEAELSELIQVLEGPIHDIDPMIKPVTGKVC